MSVRTRLLFGLIPHLAAAATIALCAWLAAWQFDRAEFKQKLTESWQEAPTLEFDSTAGAVDDYARVAGSGRFDPMRHILLDNQVRNGRAGVHVFTPFHPAGHDAVWLINRGWHPLPQRDRPLPQIDTPEGSIRLHGRLAEPPRVGAPLGESAPLDAAHWPNLMTYLDLGRIREVLGNRVQDRVILLAPEHPAHLTGDEWRPIVFGADRHRAYAWQWITMAVVVFLIWLILTLRSLKNR